MKDNKKKKDRRKYPQGSAASHAGQNSGNHGGHAGHPRSRSSKLLKNRKTLLMDLVSSKNYEPMRLKDIAMLLQVPKAKRSELAEVMEILVKEGKIDVISDGRYQKSRGASTTTEKREKRDRRAGEQGRRGRDDRFRRKNGKDGDTEKKPRIQTVDIQAVVDAYQIPEEFPARVITQAEKCPEEVIPNDYNGRLDLKSWQMVTIDGEDAKDLDDAVSVTKAGDTWTLGVHIADVSNYVQENSALDWEAKERGTSVYLPDRVIPMLPKELSNGCCSLNAGEDRLALSCLMEVDKGGTIGNYEIVESVIRVDKRMSYTQVQKILDGDEALWEAYCDEAPMLTEMAKLSKVLRQKRKERGAVDFDFPESKIELDENGEPLSIHPHERNDATKLIEDFMLAANETVAQHFYWLEEPFLYRVHDNPDPEKMQQLSVFLGNFGYRLHIGRKQGKRQENGADVHPKQLQKLLDQIEGTPEEAMLSRLILRSMKRAVYSPECSGHFGLAATHYCHFTSPIRRYPDLQIHRIIKEFLRGRLNEKRKEHYEDILNGVAKNSSETERRADEAERICEKMKKAQYMEKHIGETMEAVISGVTGWGFYAELPNTVEGLVPVSSLRSDYFIFDEENSALVGEHTGKTYQLGETVTVRVTGANRYAGTVDFELEEAEKRGNDGKISTETGREQ